MRTLSQRVRWLSNGYQGMDDQFAIASEIEALESKCAIQARLLDRARKLIELANSPDNSNFPEVSSDFLTDLGSVT
jgi:hypothetical protein